MISVLVYGRNDDYGAKLQRRAALSLNSIAEALTQPDDEIVFVDYNTADEFITFPEAIDDTLTEAARRRLRVVRVRPAFHERRVAADAPAVIESIARNIGLRRTNPANRWVLSTNPDVLMISSGTELADALVQVRDGYYGAPRHELPRFMWEQLRRTQPRQAADQVRAWCDRLPLRETVLHHDPDIGFDAPGDFQLAPRADFFAIGGFDERMQRAWHVDSNLAVRMAARLGAPSRLAGGPAVFHCEHTSGTQAKHAAQRQEDSWERFVERAADDPWSDPHWGAPEQDFEIIDLNARPARGLASMLADAAGEADSRAMSDVVYGPATYGQLPRHRLHAALFLIDRLLNADRGARLGWIGGDADNREFVSRLLVEAGFQPLTGAAEAAEALIIDAPSSRDEAGADAAFWTRLGEWIKGEAARLAQGLAPRPVLGLNAVHCDFETFLRRHFEVTLAPATTRLRPARLAPGALASEALLEALTPGPAGRRRDGTFDIVKGEEGYVFYGPYLKRLPGAHRLHVDLRIDGPRLMGRRRDERALVLEVCAGEQVFATEGLAFHRGERRVTLEFDLPAQHLAPAAPPLEVRLWSQGLCDGEVRAVILERADA
ncbi:hypothetical protein D8I30_03090 [Brevundimonas naejangsanensis]|uniref:Uncharacterized protein n=1 Tax=Brevundimonas naejangsanensis TaxID=588932 RepID=A0A494RGQ2_9CAUL|nr:hypothetical protein [Brevundimonas naejangsanensis]AYG94283.1 hypothetical protein D8I30_03090 [Brevundimonas naejangsanensis]